MTELTGYSRVTSRGQTSRHQGQELGESKQGAGEKRLSALCHVYIILQDKLAGSFRKRKALFTHCRKCKPSLLMGDRFFLSGFSCWGSAVTLEIIFFPQPSNVVQYHSKHMILCSFSIWVQSVFFTIWISQIVVSFAGKVKKHNGMTWVMKWLDPLQTAQDHRGSPEKDPVVN